MGWGASGAGRGDKKELGGILCEEYQDYIRVSVELKVSKVSLDYTAADSRVHRFGTVL